MWPSLEVYLCTRNCTNKETESSSQQLPTSSHSLTRCGNAHILSTCWNYVCHDPLQVLCVLSTPVSSCVQLSCYVQKTMSSYSHPPQWLSHYFHPLCLTDLSGRRVCDDDVPLGAESSGVSSSLQHREFWFTVTITIYCKQGKE